MNHVKAVIFGLIFLIACTAVPASSEPDIRGGVDHPLISRMPDFYISSYKSVEFGSYRFIEQLKKTPVIEGRKTYIEYRLVKDAPVPGELKIRRNVQDTLKSIGATVVFDDNFNRCSTIVLTEDGRETWVEIRSYDNMYRLNIVEKAAMDQVVFANPGSPGGRLDPAMNPRVPLGRAENFPVVQNMWPQWAEWAKKAVRRGVPQWIGMTTFKDGIVNGARVSGGYLGGPALLPFVSLEMKLAGAPDTIVAGFMGPVAEAFSSWASSARAQNFPWYPAFEVFPGPVAPPTPSPPFPLSALSQTPVFLEPNMLAVTIRTRIGGDAESPEAKAAIDDFCIWLHSGFKFWLATATLRDVIGTGPVPMFNPDARIYSGPVVNGTANGGTLSPSPSWP